MVQFFYFHLMPWPHLPEDFDRGHPSAWVTLSNRHYDPQRGHALYNEYLDELEYAETLGYDGLGVNEHHQNAYGTMPSPNLMAAALIRRTQRAKIAILGNAIPLRDHPLRIAEEVAMLDVMSGGRIVSGFVRGIGCEYLSLGVNPTHSRERFYEAHELIVRAWTEDGPFCFEGKHFRVRYANVWPRPLQKPHPPIWLPSQGSTETIRWAAQHRYPFVSVFTSYAQTRRLLEEYKAAAEAAGYTAPPEQIGFAVPTYVAESDARAREEAKPHLLWLFRRGLKMPPHFLVPPGYITETSLRKFLSAGLKPPGELSFEELEQGGYVLLGSPRTVTDRLKTMEKELGFGLFIGGGRIGDMPHDKAIKNMELFAREVIPHSALLPLPPGEGRGEGRVKYIAEPARRTPVYAETQVLVVGGGSAGTAAAVAAARNGADTMLVERSGALGGLATGGLIILLLTLDDGNGHQVVRGLCQEVTDRVAARGAAYFPPPEEWGSSDDDLIEHYFRWGLVWGSGPHKVRYSVAYDPEEFRFALNNMCESSGVRLLLHAGACEGWREGNRLRGVIFQGPNGRFAILADVVIDATGDGNVLASLGVPFELEKVLPWLWFRMGGVTDVEALGAGALRTVNRGQVLFPWGATNRIIRKIDATDPADLTLAELECRKKVMQAVDELRRDNSGFKDAHICEIARDLGITESRRMIGRYVLTREDMDRPIADCIALTGHWTKYGALYWIPYRSLLSAELPNLLVAGRCISVDHRVHHATKEIPPCMATGEAAGTAAALALRGDTTPHDLDVAALQRQLEAQGAIVRLPEG